MQLPPPVHGVSVMSNIIWKSQRIQNSFSCYKVDSGIATGIKNLQKTSVLKVFFAALVFCRLFWSLISRRYSQVYVTLFPYGAGFFKDLLLIQLCKCFGYSPFVHLHTLGFASRAQQSRFMKKMYRQVFKGTRPICLSEGLTADIKGLYEGPVFILPNGIPEIKVPEIRPRAQEKLQLVFLANLIEGKGVLLLLAALKILKQRNYRMHLTIIGEEFDITYDRLKKTANAYGIEEDLSVLGPKYGEEKAQYLQQSDVLLLPSDYDTFGLALLEAMQLGIPCIATNVGAMPEVLAEGCGIILEERSAICIAEALIYMWEHPEERRKMGQRGQERFSRLYNAVCFEENLTAILTASEPLRQVHLSV